MVYMRSSDLKNAFTSRQSNKLTFLFFIYKMSSNDESLPIPEMKPSLSINTTRFRRDYATLLKEVLEESSDEEEELLNQIDIDLDTATAELPEDLRAALEDRSLADKYLANLKTFMSHRRSQSVNSITSVKGEYSL